ncbi:hypothetical protein EPN52_00890 [bacterium]|nr:MAG: hypothetical protein EPN52_00890 [bacterium]
MVVLELSYDDMPAARSTLKALTTRYCFWWWLPFALVACTGVILIRARFVDVLPASTASAFLGSAMLGLVAGLVGHELIHILAYDWQGIRAYLMPVRRSLSELHTLATTTRGDYSGRSAAVALLAPFAVGVVIAALTLPSAVVGRRPVSVFLFVFALACFGGAGSDVTQALFCLASPTRRVYEDEHVRRFYDQ